MKIAEVSQQAGLSADTLRYYERIGLLPPVQRNASGIREYDERDLRRLHFIKCMRNVGLPVEVLIEYFALVQQGDQSRAARKQILIEQRTQLAARMTEMQQTLDLLDYKISVYDQAIVQAERAMVLIDE